MDENEKRLKRMVEDLRNGIATMLPFPNAYQVQLHSKDAHSIPSRIIYVIADRRLDSQRTAPPFPSFPCHGYLGELWLDRTRGTFYGWWQPGQIYIHCQQPEHHTAYPRIVAPEALAWEFLILLVQREKELGPWLFPDIAEVATSVAQARGGDALDGEY